MLSSSSVFRSTRTTTDSELFYNTVLDFLDDPDEKPSVDELLDWWNWSVHIWLPASRVPFQADGSYSQIFPGHMTRVRAISNTSARAISKNSALAKLKEKRAAMKLRNQMGAA